MRAREALRSAGEYLGAHKLRAGLTMLGMMFGVGAVIAMLSIGAGAERQALKLIERLGARNIVVRAREFKADDLPEIRKKSLGVSLRDVEALREAVPGVALLTPRLRVQPYKILSALGKSEAQVYGVSHQHPRLASLPLRAGRFFDALEEERHGQVCVIGDGVRRDLFGHEPPLGQELKINDLWCQVVGVLAPEGPGAATLEGVSLGSTAQEIYLPVTTALRKLEQSPLESPLQEIVIQLRPGAVSAQVAAVVGALLERLHGGVQDYDLIVPEALLAQSRQTQRLFNVVMGCIAGISLLVGGIGIMNIMLASVLEQTREIGVRRALGARRRDIRFQFLVNASALSCLGGAAGVLMGVLIARGVSLYAGWPTVVTLSSILLSTGVSAAVGLASGLYPAVRAANLDPIEALRHE